MTKVLKIRKEHNEALDKYCVQNKIGFTSMQTLLEAEKTKKLLKRNALIQQIIDREIDNSLENENR